MSHRVVAVIADPISGPEAVKQLRFAAGAGCCDACAGPIPTPAASLSQRGRA